uniref:Stomatin-like protein 2, mitochondrial (inferred by orthology to a human protein) n=1 Tax=Strongyloides venezuelensis TaxID=75913 RepID=A0A0K0F9D3_STRVS
MIPSLRILKYRNSLHSIRRTTSNVTNTIINFVPEQEAWIIERMGKFHRTLKPGLNIVLPFIDRIQYVQSLKEIAIEIPQQNAITVDNVEVKLESVLYLRVVDPYKASYGVVDPEFASTVLAQTTLRSEIGKITLDTLFKEREQLNVKIVEAINKAAEPWGLVCLRYEIKNMAMPPRIQEAMQMQVEAERKKRALILESEGKRDAAINVAEGEKKARILASEANMQEVINQAEGTARAIQLEANAKKRALEQVAGALKSNGGEEAAALSIAEKYVRAFGNLAKVNNSLIIPSNTNDVNSMVAQALAVYKNVIKKD